MKQIYWIFLIVCLFSITANSQAPVGAAEQQRQIELQKQKVEGDLQERMRNLGNLSRDGMRDGQEALIIARRDKSAPLTKEQRAIIERTLSPNPDDSAKYKSFLKQSNTGLFRLFPDLDCEPKKLVVRVDGDCGSQIPGTWFYSFRQKNYSDDTLYDLRLKDEKLIVGGFLLQGILVQLGDIPLEDISLASSGMKFLVDFKPERQDEEIKKQSLEIAKGIESDGYEYKKNIKALENMTYAMRVIAYRNENKPIRLDELNAENKKFLAVSFDKRKDLILTFRIIRKEADGNLTILWKELAKDDAPKIIHEKLGK